MSIRVGVVGAGWMADRMIADLQRHRSFTVAGVTARTPERTVAFAARMHTRAFADGAAMLAHGVNLAYVCTTPASHFEISRELLQRGVPVLLEKVFTTTAREASILIGESHRHDIFLMEAMWMRFNPLIRRVAEFVRQGGIGEPRTLLSSAGYPAPEAIACGTLHPAADRCWIKLSIRWCSRRCCSAEWPRWTRTAAFRDMALNLWTWTPNCRCASAMTRTVAACS